jgi:prolipoprotein diacylglyceryltransferase
MLAIEGGKAAMAWGGSGQGTLNAAGWATRYVGPGPWGSLAPELPAHPSQLYEAGVAFGIAALLTAAMAAGAFRRRDGRLLLIALAAWLVGRAAVATTWRDPAVLGPLSADQVLSLVVAGGCLGGLAYLQRRRSRAAASGPLPDWPDPAVSETWRSSPGG